MDCTKWWTVHGTLILIFIKALFGVNEFFIMLSVLCFISLLAFWAISNYSRDYFVDDAISSGTDYSEMSDQPLANQREESINYKSPDVTGSHNTTDFHDFTFKMEAFDWPILIWLFKSLGFQSFQIILMKQILLKIIETKILEFYMLYCLFCASFQMDLCHQSVHLLPCHTA